MTEDASRREVSNAVDITDACRDGRHYACGRKGCPCGCHLNGSGNKRRPHLGKAIAGVFVFFVLIIIVGAIASSGSPDHATPENTDTPTTAQLNDASYLDSKYDLLASTQCAEGADDYLRAIAKYDFAWDHTGLLESKFDKYLGHVKSPGVLTVASTKAKLQNGFGAFQHITLYCDYDTQAQKVLGYNFQQ